LFLFDFILICSENILVDTVNGECVFVDFDCLFDKGLQLSGTLIPNLNNLFNQFYAMVHYTIVPEIVPFRLTPNMVDAMGVMGVEGVYRRTMEVCLNTLRLNKESLLSILEPFLNDPTVAWARKGRAQIADLGASSKNSRTPRDNSADAEEALKKIGDRLRGIYNLSHPKAKTIMQAYVERNVALPSKGLGALKGDEFLLSVKGQVQRLIEEATAEENLAQMFHGWQPWL
jgi:serine/threonine-protein kinase ATR